MIAEVPRFALRSAVKTVKTVKYREVRRSAIKKNL